MSVIRPWTERQIAVALQMEALGMSQRLIAERLGRTEPQVGALLRKSRKQQQEKAAHD